MTTWKALDHSNHPNVVIRNAWNRGVQAINPTAAQLQRGLELHARFVPGDTFGFLPSVWTQEVADLWNELKEGNIGPRELRLQAGFARSVCATRDAAAASEYLDAVRASGLRFMVQTVAEGKSREQDIKRMSTFRQVCRVMRKSIVQAGSADEVREAAEHGQLAIIWSVNGPPLAGLLEDADEELGWIDTWYYLGVRLMHMTYNRRNFVGDGCAEPANGGLSDLGRELIARLNKTGIIVDVPHSGMQTTLDAARASTKPMMASHTGAKGVFDHMRLKSDEEIKAIAATGGMVGVLALANMLGPKATLGTLLNHVDYIAKLVGVEHVGIGTDSCYQSNWPHGLSKYDKSRFSEKWWGNWKPDNHPLPPSDETSAGSLAWTNWPLYTVGLVTRGYSDEDIEKILGDNFLRILEANHPEKEVRL